MEADMKYSRKILEESEVILFDRPKSISEYDRRGSLRVTELPPHRRFLDVSWAELLGESGPAPTLYYADGSWIFREDRTTSKTKKNQTVWEGDSPTKVGRFPKRPSEHEE
jgi:hypothetical protein